MVVFALCVNLKPYTPSLVISPEKNLWHCLGACQAGGTVIDWVMKTQNVSFRHAVELLRDHVSSLAAPPAATVTNSETDVSAIEILTSGGVLSQLSSPVTADADDQQLIQQVITYYHHTLQQVPEALAYLEQRGQTALASANNPYRSPPAVG